MVPWQGSDSPLSTAACRSALPLHPGPEENPEKGTKDEETGPTMLSASSVLQRSTAHNALAALSGK